MKNEAAKLVTESILGVDFQTVFIAGKPYTIYPPTIKIVCRGLKEWSSVDIELNKEENISLANIPDNAPIMLKGLAFFVIGDVQDWEDRSNALYEEWINGTPSVTVKEMFEACKIVCGLLGVNDFFGCAALLKNVVMMAAKPIS